MLIENFNLDEKVFIIAELSANHGNDISIVKESMKAAKDAGADAIKIQTYTADTLTIDSDKEYFKLDSGTIWDGRTLYELYSEGTLPWEWHKELMDYANRLGLIFFSTPFDYSAVDFLEELNVPVYKIASFEAMDIPLIEYAASKGKPMIISTGVSTLNDIEEAVAACRRVGNNDVVLLKTTSSYPAKVEDANLNTIPNIKETFNVEVGLSDHTMGITVPVVSVALGARVIEKHFILDKAIGGPDASFSLTPEEFGEMVKSVREAEQSLGTVDYSMSEGKKNNRKIGRSLFIVEDVKAGEPLNEKNVRSIRPGFGLEPKYYKEVLGKIATQDLERGTPLTWKHFD